MQAELIEIREFLAEHPPFDQLPADVLDTLPKRLTVRYLRRGSPFPPDTADTSSAVVLRMGAIELRDAQGELVEKLGEGDFYAAGCPDAGASYILRGKCVEDSLLYLLPCDELQGLRDRFDGFNRHFEQNLRSRLQHALMQLQQSQGATSNLMGLETGTLVRRAPVTAGPGQTIREAAQKMSKERVSSLLILEQDELLGIVTDRDLRERCIAAGIDVDRPVSDIMTREVFSLEAQRTAFDALLEMTRRQLHHLPVVNRKKELLGVVSSSDILQQHSLNTVSLVSTIRRCKSVDELVTASAQLPELQLQFIGSGMTADHLTQALSPVIDAISQRLLTLAEEQLGPPPVPYAWLVCGSQARREQTTVSDQDNALLIDDAMKPEDDAWFAALANFVNDGLAQCGFEYCPGEVMARNPKWRQPFSRWREYFDSWINNTEPMALMHSSIFFDIRALHGDESLYQRLREEVLQQCRENSLFLAYMAANALKHRPPLGFFRQFVLVHDGEHDDSLDLKHRGVIPVVDLVRVFALSAGLSQLNTRERIMAAEEARALSHDGAGDLLHALDYISTLRARHQTEQHLAGEPMDNYIKPDSLSRVERAQLKDAFAAISRMQEAMEQRYQSARFA